MDGQAFAERYRLLYGDLYRFALCVTGNAHDAEDAVAEGVLAAYEHRGQLRRAEAFKSWLFQIVANRCRRRLAVGKRCAAADPKGSTLPCRLPWTGPMRWPCAGLSPPWGSPIAWWWGFPSSAGTTAVRSAP